MEIPNKVGHIDSKTKESRDTDPVSTLIFDLTSDSIERFEENAGTASDFGATHMVITGDLPPARWQRVLPDDPYPEWFMWHPDFLKLFAPETLKPYVDLAYAERVREILRRRCVALRTHGLKAAWSSNAPQVLPEAFFIDHPDLRGPRVDQMHRARMPYFAPCVDQPETMLLYRQAVQNLLAECPEIEIFSFLTTDCGSGFCWSPGLYPGINGPLWCRERPMADRVSGFLIDLQDAAADVGRTIEININQIEPRQWMIPSFGSPMEIVRRLRPGLALNGMEGPDGRRFMDHSGIRSWRSPFLPVVGIPNPSLFRTTQPDEAAPRRTVSFGDPALRGFNLRLYQALSECAASDHVARLMAMRALAEEETTAELADDVLSVWAALSELDIRLDTLDFGPMFRMGHLLGRWINRPLVPFPDELTEEEKAHYRPYLFQAKSEEQADNLVDIQGMRMYEGWGAKLLFERVIETSVAAVRKATRIVARIRDGVSDRTKEHSWGICARRLEAVECLVLSAGHVVAYQAFLDRARAQAGEEEPEPAPPLGTRNSWEREGIMQVARDEIDTTVRLRRLLLDSDDDIIVTAERADDETIQLLSPRLADQLKRKIDIMNVHWLDYDRLYTRANP